MFPFGRYHHGISTLGSVAELPTYGYRRVHAILKRRTLAAGRKPPNHKRIYRVMKAHGLLLDRHAGGAERRHDGRIAMDEAIGVGAPTASRLAVTTVRRCGLPSHWTAVIVKRMSFLATTSGIRGEDVRDLMVAAVEHRFGRVDRLPLTIEWLSDNGTCYVAGDTRSFARDIGLRAENDAHRKSTKQWNGRGLRTHDQTRLRPRQSHVPTLKP